MGNSLLDSVGITNIGNSMEDRFRARTGHGSSRTWWKASWPAAYRTTASMSSRSTRGWVCSATTAGTPQP